MNVKLYINESNNNVLNKKITLISEDNILLKYDVDVYKPIVKIKKPLLNNCNYVYIEDFKRYYYITNKKSINTDVIELSLKCDVLMSFKNDILNSKGLIIKSENLINNYINSDIYVNDVREKTRVINFENGFNDTPEFILITAGATII